LNGDWQGNTNFSILGGLRFFFGGIAIPPLGDEQLLNKVIDPQVRYGAATALWLMLTQALSPAPGNPDFLRRLNAQLQMDGITEASGLLPAIQQIAGDARIEGLPVLEWLPSQAIRKTAPAASNYLFIDVRNPENPDAITVYAIAKEDLSSPFNPLGDLAIGELPARNCIVHVKMIDAHGFDWLNNTTGRTDPEGKFVVPITAHLPVGGYVIQATADDCDRVREGPFQSRVPSNLRASTFAIVRGAGQIAGPDSSLFGATLTPSVPTRLTTTVLPVGALTIAAVIKPGVQQLHPSNGPGFFAVEVTDPRTFSPFNPLEFLPYEVLIGQEGREAPEVLGRFKHPRTILKPNPYTRIIWLGTSPDFFVTVEPKRAAIAPGRLGEATVELIPNGVPHQTTPGSRCTVNLASLDVPAGVRADLIPPPGHTLANLRLDQRAPAPTEVQMRITVRPEARPGTYNIALQGVGDIECRGFVRTAIYELTIPRVDIPRVDVDLGLQEQSRENVR
jgi:hypothetical protein